MTHSSYITDDPSGLTALSEDAEYHFELCQDSDAEVEVYRILDAPPTLTSRRGREYPNPRAVVLHAHRRDHRHLDAPPKLGCSSKLANGPLVAHNRWALEDTRPWASGNPSISYGSIFQYWRRTAEHPSFPGKEHNLVPATGNYPDSWIFASGYGKHPAGHPGNTKGLPYYAQGNNQSPLPTSGGMSNAAQSFAGSFSSNRGGKAKEEQSRKVASATSRPAMASLDSKRRYAQVPRMRAHDSIPLPSRAAQDSAVLAYNKTCQSSPSLVREFETRFHAWQRSWHSSSRGVNSDASVRCNVAEFNMLLEMGPCILPLVVYKLLDSRNFTNVFLYNALERDTRYLIDPSDVLNYLVLQRQNNLIIELNQERKW